ncbi:MAG: hypothetical protein JNK02_00310 [Planctomycetes bacterium]|nr:hypothetical protein [Planctomycetota bacterium]
MTLRRALLLLPPVLLATWCLVRWGALPERFATSFGFDGRPRDSMGRGGFVALALAVSAALPLVLGGLSAWIARVPDHLVNLPDREYWLAPERRAGTLARLRTFLEFLGLAQGALFALLFAAIGEHAIRGGGRFPAAWIGLPILFVAGVGAGLVWLLRPILARRRASRRAR